MHERIRKNNQKLKLELTEEVEKASQEDTIDTLTEVVNESYNIHEERIQRVKNHLHLPPLKS